MKIGNPGGRIRTSIDQAGHRFSMALKGVRIAPFNAVIGQQGQDSSSVFPAQGGCRAHGLFERLACPIRNAEMTDLQSPSQFRHEPHAKRVIDVVELTNHASREIGRFAPHTIAVGIRSHEPMRGGSAILFPNLYNFGDARCRCSFSPRLVPFKPVPAPDPEGRGLRRA